TALAAEAHRRDMLARLFPGGNLADDLADVGDDALGWAMQYATSDEVLRIAAEMDRRDAIELPAPAATGDAVADMLADRGALADAGAAARGCAMRYGRSDELLRIAAEMDRRDAIELPAPAATGDAVADMLADRDALADAMDPAPDPEQWGTLLDDDAAFAA